MYEQEHKRVRGLSLNLVTNLNLHGIYSTQDQSSAFNIFLKWLTCLPSIETFDPSTEGYFKRGDNSCIDWNRCLKQLQRLKLYRLTKSICTDF